MGMALLIEFKEIRRRMGAKESIFNRLVATTFKNTEDNNLEV